MNLITDDDGGWGREVERVLSDPKEKKKSCLEKPPLNSRDDFSCFFHVKVVVDIVPSSFEKDRGKRRTPGLWSTRVIDDAALIYYYEVKTRLWDEWWTKRGSRPKQLTISVSLFSSFFTSSAVVPPFFSDGSSTNISLIFSLFNRIIFPVGRKVLSSRLSSSH